MGDFRGTRYLLILLVYFAGLITFLTLTEVFANEYDLEYGVNYSTNFTAIAGLTPSDIGECGYPREFINPATGETDEVPSFIKHTSLCKYSSGSANPEKCEDIDGCFVENETFLFFFTTDVIGCGGYVNLTNYTTVPTVRVDLSGTTKTFINGTEGKFPIYCELFTNQTTCQDLGCNWRDYEEIPETVSEFDVFTILGDLITFQATFSNNGFINIILTFILFYIPSVMFIIGLYYSLPFLH